MATSNAKIVVSAEDRTARVLAGIRSNLGAVGSQADAVSLGFLALGRAIPALAVASAFVGLIKGATTGVDRLNDLADATGSSIENLSGLESIGLRTGASLDTVGSAVLKLNKNLLDAQDPTSNAAGLFRQLGLNVGELSKLDPSQALLRVATALNGFADGASKGRFLTDLLGKSTRDLSSFLKDLAEEGTITATALTRDAQEAEKFNKELFKLNAYATEVARTLGGPVVRSMNDLIEKFRESRERGESFYKFMVDRFGASNRGSVLGEFLGISEGPDVKYTPPESYARGRRKKPELETPDRPDKPTRTSDFQAAKDRLTDAQQYLENLQLQLRGTQDLSVAETVLADIRDRRLKLAKGESAQPLLDIAAEIDQAKRRQEQLRAETDQVRDLRAEQEKLRAAGAGVFDATRTPREKLTADLEELRSLLAKGAIDTDTYYRRVKQLDDAFDELGKQKDAVKELDEYTQRAAQNIQDALGDELSNVLDGNFRNIGDSFKRTLDRMVSEAIAADLNRAIFANAGVSGGSGGSEALFKGLLNLGSGLFGGGANTTDFRGSILPNSLRGGAATGSNVLERDMITLLHKGEAVVPKEYNPAAGGAGGAGRNVSVVNHFHLSGPVDRRSQQQIADAAGRGIQLAMGRNG